MTYDAARHDVVLFGGLTVAGDVRDTWTWDGTAWTKQHSVTSPSVRDGFGAAFDSARAQVVIFGGDSDGKHLSSTWTWGRHHVDGTNWQVPFVAQLGVSPDSGPPGKKIKLIGTGFSAVEDVTIRFIDSVVGTTVLGTFPTDATGKVVGTVKIPADATVGPHKITARGSDSHQKANTTFAVT